MCIDICIMLIGIPELSVTMLFYLYPETLWRSYLNHIRLYHKCYPPCFIVTYFIQTNGSYAICPIRKPSFGNCSRDTHYSPLVEMTYIHIASSTYWPDLEYKMATNWRASRVQVADVQTFNATLSLYVSGCLSLLKSTFIVNKNRRAIFRMFPTFFFLRHWDVNFHSCRIC